MKTTWSSAGLVAACLLQSCAAQVGPCDGCDADGTSGPTIPVRVVAAAHEPGLPAPLPGVDLILVAPDGTATHATTGGNGEAQIAIPTGTTWDLTARAAGFATTSVIGIRDASPITLRTVSLVAGPSAVQHQISAAVPHDAASAYGLMGPSFNRVSPLTMGRVSATFIYYPYVSAPLRSFLVGYGDQFIGTCTQIPLWVAPLTPTPFSDHDIALDAPTTTTPTRSVSIAVALPPNGLLSASALSTFVSNGTSLGWAGERSLLDQAGMDGVFNVCGSIQGSGLQLTTAWANGIADSPVMSISIPLSSPERSSVQIHAAEPHDGDTIRVNELRSLDLTGSPATSLACRLDADGYVANQLIVGSWFVFSGGGEQVRAPRLPSPDSAWSDAVGSASEAVCIAEQRQLGAPTAPFAAVYAVDPDTMVRVFVRQPIPHS